VTKIEMLANKQAGGEQHFIGEVVDVPEDSARALVRAGNARLVDEPEPDAAEPEPEAAAEAEPEDTEGEPEPPEADEPEPEPKAKRK